MKRLVFLSFVSAWVLSCTVVFDAQAHVFVRDTSGNKGAILHIAPDDDPIAGKKATLFFDMQEVNLTRKVSLTVTDEQSNKISRPTTKREGTLIKSEFIFPTQGVYKLRYSIKDRVEAHIFEQSVRISRGSTIMQVKETRHLWAEGVLIACMVSFLVLCIVIFNRRKEIALQSSF